MHSSKPVAEPVRDEIPRIEDAVSVGEDLDFQRSWWRFEKLAWIILAVVLAADALGVFGRGWLAKAQRHAADHSLQLSYERIQRAGTPSMMTIEFAPSAVEGSEVHLLSSLSIVKELGAQRIIPQPQTSAIGPAGITYTFPVTGSPRHREHSTRARLPGGSSY
jgi:hypothetical protein